MNIRGALIASAAATLFAAGCAGSTTNMAQSGSMVKCTGVNACKGQGMCGAADHSCKGQNSCKGKGFIKVSKADCDSKGGSVM